MATCDPRDDRSDGYQAWGAFLRAHADLVHRMDRSLRHDAGVSLREYDALFQIDGAGGSCTMKELEGRVLISQSALSRLVSRLADDGLVERSTNAGDRRGVDLRLSRRGRSELRKARAVQSALVGELFVDRMSLSETRTVLAVMRRLSEQRSA